MIDNVNLKNIYDVFNFIDKDCIIPYGRYKAKLDIAILDKLSNKKNGKLILVTAITPTKQGEGKSTITIGLSQAINKLNYKSIAVMREPSMGPVFGIKGGATGGGKAQIHPIDEINLNFTGDMHAITAANNLIAAVIDNHIYWGNKLNIDINNIFFKRAIDTNDRSLRSITIHNKKYDINTSFQITVATELMAIFCLSNDIYELKEKIENIAVAKNLNGGLVYVKDLKVAGAVCKIMETAINPNLVQTSENTPAIIHGGPFANIAHGCNSIIATKTALKLCDFVVTEAGFAADLGAEKFFDIKCRVADVKPNLAVLVITTKAVKEHGLDNIKVHIENLRKFNIDIVAVLNKFKTDKKDEIQNIKNFVSDLNCPFVTTDAFNDGGDGCVELAKTVIKNISQQTENKFKFLYSLTDSIEGKIQKLVFEIYRASDIIYSDKAKEKLEFFKKFDIHNMPVCVSKTPVSITNDPKLAILPEKYTFHITDIDVNFGAGFIVVKSENIVDMPALPEIPLAETIDIT